MFSINFLKQANFKALSIFLFILGVIILIAHILHIRAGREVISEVNKSQLMVIEEISYDYQSLMQEVQEKLKSLAKLYTVNQVKASKVLFDLQIYYELMHDTLAHIGIMNQYGKYEFFYPKITRFEELKEKDFSTMDFFQNALNQVDNNCSQAPFISTHYNQGFDIKAIPISLPLYSDIYREEKMTHEKIFLGVLIFFLDFAVIDDLCQNHYAHLHDYSSFWLIDEKGTFLSHEKRDWIGKNVFEINDGIFKGENLHGIDWVINECMLKNISGTDIYMDNYYNKRGRFEKCYVNYTPVRFSGRDWAIAATTPAIKMNHWEQRVLKSAWQWMLFTISFILILLSFMQIMIFFLNKKRIYWEKAQREKFQAAFDGILDFVYMIDTDHNLIIVNNALMKICNKSDKIVEGKKCFQLIQNRQSPCPDCPIPETRATLKTQRLEKIIFNETARLFAYPLTNDEGKTKAIVIFAHIITKEKILEQELLHRERLSLIGKLAACVAHEIKNPLVGIGMLSQLVRDSVPGGDGIMVKNLNNILKECQRLEKLIDNLSKFSRTAPLSCERADIHKSLDLSLALVREKLKVNNIQLKTNYHPNIPSFKHDVQKMQQVFLNLIINSINAMPNGGTLHIHTYIRHISSNNNGGKSKGFKLYIDIKDTGLGISKELNKSIFKPFFSTSMDGTGLGLYIVQNIIQQHGGSICVESKQGQGTLFSIYIPVYQDTTDLKLPNRLYA